MYSPRCRLKETANGPDRTNRGGPHRLTVPAQRTLHVRFDELGIPADTDYSSVIESDVPIEVQHTRLDSRQAELALLSTIAYAE